MSGKLIVSLMLVTLVTAQNFDEFMLKINEKQGFEIDHSPCSGRAGPHFGKNSRGCSWFFQCNEFNEIVNENRCPEGYYFNYPDQNCAPRDLVPCSVNNVTETCPQESGITVIPHPYTCSKFTVCFDGIENDRSCEPGLHFSYYDNKCVSPFLADCNLDYALCKESVLTGVPVFIANSRDCRSFYVCVGETPVPLTCAPGSHFDPENRWCVAPEEANCTASIPDDQPEIPEIITIDCNGVTGQTFPHPDSCKFFFFCAGDRSYLQFCGADLAYDINSRRCVNAENAVCANAPQTELPTLPPPTEGPTDSPTEAPTAPPTEAPTAPPTETPTDPPTEGPTDPPTEAPTAPPTETPTDPPTEAPTAPPTQTPTDPPTEVPTDPSTEPATDPPTTTTEVPIPAPPQGLLKRFARFF